MEGPGGVEHFQGKVPSVQLASSGENPPIGGDVVAVPPQGSAIAIGPPPNGSDGRDWRKCTQRVGNNRSLRGARYSCASPGVLPACSKGAPG